ncbi:MAG: tRNA lysidine(34) synthetase TilS [Verrucomicrobiaceae bacterium]|nr:tRNA lysidine(34) synthetase TilS [Verrucomicrobiaceae bacterium]
MLQGVREQLFGFDRSATSLVGVSGGVDSVVLLHVLKEIGFKNLIVCHLNHQLRPKEAEKDEYFVRRLAEKLNFTLDVAEVDVAGYAAENKLSVELSARVLRYQYFEMCAEEHGADKVFLAHHADDQAETVLMNVLRGTGVTGMAGMRFMNQLEGGLKLVRPFLGVRRSEIEDYAKAGKINWREDASNASSDYTRNRLRHEALPLLSEIMQRDTVTRLVSLAELAREDDDALNVLAMEAREACADTGGGTLKCSELKKQPRAIQRRVVLNWLRTSSVPGVGMAEVEAVLGLLTEETPARVNLPGGLQVRRKSKTLTIAKQDA